MELSLLLGTDTQRIKPVTGICDSPLGAEVYCCRACFKKNNTVSFTIVARRRGAVKVNLPAPPAIIDGMSRLPKYDLSATLPLHHGEHRRCPDAYPPTRRASSPPNAKSSCSPPPGRHFSAVGSMPPPWTTLPVAREWAKPPSTGATKPRRSCSKPSFSPRRR